MKWGVGFSLILLVQLTFADNYTQVSECRNGLTLPKVKVVINNKLCITSPCTIGTFGTTADVTLFFKAPQVIENISQQLTVTLGTTPISIPDIFHGDCSNLLNTICPLAKGELTEYKYVLSLPIIPKGIFALEFSLKDAEIKDPDYKGFVCFEIDLLN